MLGKSIFRRFKAPGAIAKLLIAMAVWGFAAPAFAQLTVSMTVPAPYSPSIQAGDTTALKITITNGNTASAINNTAFSLNLQANAISELKVLDGGAGNGGVVSYTCINGAGATTVASFNGAGLITAGIGGNTIALSGATIPLAFAGQGSGRCEMTVLVTSTKEGANEATIPVAGVTGNDGGAVINNQAAPQTISVFAFPKPTIGKSFSAPTGFFGQTRTLTIQITNNSGAGVSLPMNKAGNTPAYGLRDTLPAGLEVASPNGASATPSCGIGVGDSFAPVPGSNIVELVGGTIAAGDTCTLTVNVVGTTIGAKNNVIDKDSDFFNIRGVEANADATATLTVSSSLDVSLFFSRDPIAIGQDSTFRTIIRNLGGTPLVMNGTFTDILGKIDANDVVAAGAPGEGLIIQAFQPLNSNTCGGAVNIAPDGKSYTLTGATFPVGVTCTLEFTYQGFLTAAAAADGAQNFKHSIFAGAIPVVGGVVSGDSVLSVNVYQSLITDKVIAQPSNGVVAGGQPVQFKLTTGNYGTNTKVVITDPLPSGMVVLTNAPYQFSGNGDTPACDTANITLDATDTTTPVFTYSSFPGSTNDDAKRCDLFFWAMPPANIAAGALDNILDKCHIRSGVTAASGGRNAALGTGTCALRGTGGSGTFAPPITISEQFSLTTVAEGTVVTLTYTLSNLGASNLTNAAFANTLPAGMTVAPTPGVVNNCGGTVTAIANSNSVSLTGGNVGPRDGGGFGGNPGTCTIVVNVTGTAGAYVNNIAGGALTGLQVQGNGSNAAASSPPQTVSASITFTSALFATKSFSPSTVSSGGQSRVTITLQNGSLGPYNSVAFTDPLPVGMVVAPTPNPVTTCAGSPTFNPVAAASSVSLTGAVLPASGVCTAQFNVVATGGGNWVNTIPGGNITAAGGIQNVLPVAATLTNGSAAAVVVTNATSPSSLTAPGQVSVLTVTLTNPGTIPLTGLGVTNYLTANGLIGGAATGMVIASPASPQTTCAGGTVTVLDSTSFRLSGASLAPNGVSCTFQVNVTLLELGTRTNIIPVGAVINNESISNTAQATTNLALAGEIGVVKSFTPTVVKPNVPSLLQITLYNLLTTSVNSLAFTDTLPVGVTVAVSPPAPPTTNCTGATLNVTSTTVGITGGQLAASVGNVAQVCTIDVYVVSPTLGAYNNTIPINGVTGLTNGATPVQNVVAANATLQVRTPVAISKAFTNPTRTPGQANTLTITLSNPNNIQLTNSALTDNLPSGLTVALTPNASTTCAGGAVSAPASATSITLTGATLPASNSCTITVNVVSNVSGTYVNTIPASALSTLIGVTNELPATDTMIVYDPPTVGKSFTPPSIQASGTSVLSIVLGNTNATAATLTAPMTDPLPVTPGAILVQTPPNSSSTCLGTAFAPVAGAASVTVPTGAIIPAGGCTVTVDVTGLTVGTHTNTIVAGALQTTHGVNVQPASSNLVISPLGFLSGRVFRDNNVTPNGLFDGSDTGISGVTINLTGSHLGPDAVVGGGDDNPAFSASTTTDALGNYYFTGLFTGTYTITEPAQPASTLNGVTTAGTGFVGGTGTAGTATATSTTPSAITGIVLNAGVGTVAGLPGNNFAEITPSSLAGVVFLDQDNNGLKDGSDTFISGQTIELLNNLNAVVGTTTTDGSGAYLFSTLAPGTYTIRQVAQPVGTNNGITTAGAVGNGGTAGTATNTVTTPSLVASLVLPPNTASTGNNFAETPVGRQISGRVYTDVNSSTVFDGGDTGIAGQTINLTGTDINGAVNATTTTDVNGQYTFTNLLAGTYTVTQPAQPAGTTNGTTNVGSTGGVATLQAVTPSVVSGINLNGANVTSTDNNFGEVATVAPGGPAIPTTVAGVVYVDTDDDGLVDVGELRVAGVTVTLTGTAADGNPVSLSTTTDAQGAYLFTGVPPSNGGGYTITQTQPSAYLDGKTTVPSGQAGTSASSKPVASGGQDIISGVIVLSNSPRSDYNFGERPPGGSVKGVVYVDANSNSVLDSTETGIANVSVRLTGTDANGAAVDRTTLTDSTGAYAFTGLMASNGAGYTITETQPTGYLDGATTIASGNPGTASSTKPVAVGGTDVIGAVVMNSTAQLTGYDFGERLPGGAVRGVVYLDANVNGVRDAGDTGIASVSVRLTGTDANGTAVDRTTLTDSTGAYAFTGLTATNGAGYTITETQPTGYLDGATTKTVGNPGVASSTKPVAVGGLDVIGAVVLTSGTELTGYDFGERIPGAVISGYVFVDGDDDGVRDPGEAAIPDVTVRLTGVDVDGNAVSLVRVTGADGAFTFNGLPPSNGAGYVITEVQPSGFNDGRTVVASGNPGTAAGGKPITPGDNDQINGVVVQATSRLTDYRFGEVAIPLLKPPIINGYVYLDREHRRVRRTDGSMEGQPGWTVTLRQNGQAICTTTTDADGFYQFDNLHCPGYEVSGLPTGPGFSIIFTKDGGSLPAVPTSAGNRGQVPPTGGQILNITLSPSDKVVEQNLPLDPAGIIYNSVTRQPIPGATIVITGPPTFNPATQLVGGLAAATQVTGTDGYYGFLLQSGFPTGVYTLTVTAPTGYLPAPSTLLPPCANTLTVTLTPAPALIQASDFAPGLGVTPQLNPNTCPGQVAGGATTTQYFFNFVITNGGSADILNNHIPLDPVAVGALMVTKTTPLVTTARGGLVPYTITATNPNPTALNNVSIRDQVPAGFKFIEGSATRNAQRALPVVVGRDITWPTENFAPKEKKTYTLILVVGAGVGDGDYVNRAWITNTPGDVLSNIATATVRIVPDPTLDCPDIIGKVFDDKNANGYQDDGEPGIPAVRMATPNGMLITSDAEGRFHVPCPATPNMDRGSNFVMKLDERSLPSGFRVTTENPRDVRVTRGKLAKLNFGATIHRVVRLELAAAAFEGDSLSLLPTWRTALNGLPAKLETQPSVVRIAYKRGSESADLAGKRAREIRGLILDAWKQQRGRYTLLVEIEGAK